MKLLPFMISLLALPIGVVPSEFLEMLLNKNVAIWKIADLLPIVTHTK
jgi:hypothetical protein